MSDRPIQQPARGPDTSVLVPGALALGPRPDRLQLKALVGAGISAVLSLQQPREAPAPRPGARRGLLWARIPLADALTGGSMSLARLRQAVERIQAWRAQGRMVYVHCHLGIGRAPTVCAAYLAASEGLSLGEALERVKAVRPGFSPSAQQLRVLAEFVAKSNNQVISNQ